MALFIKINPKSYKKRLQQQKANLRHVLNFNSEDKQRVSIIYDDYLT